MSAASSVARFRDSLRGDHPPETASAALDALWWVGKGDWSRAHAIVAGHEGAQDCDHVHAHLHRREGDDANARYWYRRSGVSVPDDTLDAEWDALAAAFFGSRARPGRHASRGDDD